MSKVTMPEPFGWAHDGLPNGGMMFKHKITEAHRIIYSTMPLYSVAQMEAYAAAKVQELRDGRMGFEITTMQRISEGVIPICEMDAHFTDQVGTEQMANAHLIAAAPELLQALEEVIDYQGGADSALEDEYVVGRILSAIAKARGEV